MIQNQPGIALSLCPDQRRQEVSQRGNAPFEIYRVGEYRYLKLMGNEDNSFVFKRSNNIFLKYMGGDVGIYGAQGIV